MAINAIFASILSAIAGEVTKSVIGTIHGKTPVTIDIKVFQKEIETALQQMLNQFDNEVESRFSDSNERINLIENSLNALIVTVNDINQQVGFIQPDNSPLQLIIAPAPTVTNEDVFFIANRNTKLIFDQFQREAITKAIEVNQFESEQERIQELKNRAAAIGMELILTDLSVSALDKIEIEILKREDTISLYEEKTHELFS